MTGWRLGYAAAPEEIAMAINKVHQLAIMSAPTQAQYAALEAMRHGAAGVERMREVYDGRRRYILKAMRELGIDVFEALGAFYVFPHIAPFGLSSEAFCERLLLDYKVAIVPGDAFGDCGAGYARVCYAASQESIEEAMRRLGAFLRQLKEEQRGT